MEKNIYSYTPEDERESVSRSSVIPALMAKVYQWMTLALVMTGLTAFYVARSEALLYTIVNNSGVLIGLLIGELALVLILSSCIRRLSFPVAGLMFALYSILNGATLSVIFLTYTLTSIASAFFVTASTFAAMSLFGMLTKKDLSGLGNFFLMALFGLIIGGVANMFVGSSIGDWLLTYAGVLIFCGLTAYDTQKMKAIFNEQVEAGETNLMKVALLGSLSLYLDFVNLFLYILRIFDRD